LDAGELGGVMRGGHGKAGHACAGPGPEGHHWGGDDPEGVSVVADRIDSRDYCPRKEGRSLAAVPADSVPPPPRSERDGLGEPVDLVRRLRSVEDSPDSSRPEDLDQVLPLY